MAVYLDHAASAPLSGPAAAAVSGWLTSGYGNPSGSHAVARRARLVVEEARDAVAALGGVDPAGVVFTSGGTEADNLAVLGTVAARAGAIVTTAIEHPAVLRAAAASGREVRICGVDAEGRLDLDHLRGLLDRDVALVSVQLVNHETGVIQDLEPVSRLVRRRSPDALLHTDAVQAAAWAALAEAAAPADLLSISAHKMGGPQGAGALLIRGGVQIGPIIHGGGQEAERRSGTHNVAAIAGMGAAAARREPGDVWAAVERRRDVLEAAIVEATGATVTSAGVARAPGHLHLRFGGLESEELLFLLDDAGVCASAGAACASGALEPSPVLLAMGVPAEEARGALRLTLGPGTTDGDVDAGCAAVVAAVSALRGCGLCAF